MLSGVLYFPLTTRRKDSMVKYTHINFHTPQFYTASYTCIQLYDPLWEYKQGCPLLSYIIIYMYSLLPTAIFLYSVPLLVPNSATGATSH